MLIRSIGFSVQPRMNNNKPNNQKVAFKAMTVEEVTKALEKTPCGRDIIRLAKLELGLEKFLLGNIIESEEVALVKLTATIEAHLIRLEKADKLAVFTELMAKENLLINIPRGSATGKPIRKVCENHRFSSSM